MHFVYFLCIIFLLSNAYHYCIFSKCAIDVFMVESCNDSEMLHSVALVLALFSIDYKSRGLLKIKIS